MLVLTRKKDQKILIGNDIVISVSDIKNDQVKLGIEAPRNVRVYRYEVYKSIQAENRLAVLSQIDAIENIPDDYLPQEYPKHHS